VKWTSVSPWRAGAAGAAAQAGGGGTVGALDPAAGGGLGFGASTLLRAGAYTRPLFSST